MKKFNLLIFPLVALLALVGCKTDDVTDPTVTIDLQKFHPISAPFAEYLEFNTTDAQTTASRRLPEGIAIVFEDQWYLNKDFAKTVSNLYLTQNTANIDALQAAGYSGYKITDVSGIEFFTAVTQLYLTNTDIEGTFDLGFCPALTIFQGSTTYLSAVVNVPAGITDFRCAPKSAATNAQKLTSLDLSACSGISNIALNSVLIPNNGLLLPENPTATPITATLTGATGIPYHCSQAFYDKLDANSKPFFMVYVEVPSTPGPFTLSWNANGFTGANPSGANPMSNPWTITSSLPTDLTAIGIANIPALMKGSGIGTNAGNADTWGGSMGKRDTPDASIADNLYFSISIVAALPVLFDNLSTYLYAGTNNAARYILLQYSTDNGGSFTNLETFDFDGFIGQSNPPYNLSYNFGGGLELPAGTTIFRFVPYGQQTGGTGSSGAMYFVNSQNPANQFVITGETK